MADDDPDPAPSGVDNNEQERARKERTACRRVLDAQHRDTNDLDVAAACESSCRPHPGRPDLYVGDWCSCQWTDTTRAAHHGEFNGVAEQSQVENMRDLAAAAAELDTEASEEVPTAAGTTSATKETRTRSSSHPPISPISTHGAPPETPVSSWCAR